MHSNLQTDCGSLFQIPEKMNVVGLVWVRSPSLIQLIWLGAREERKNIVFQDTTPGAETISKTELIRFPRRCLLRILRLVLRHRMWILYFHIDRWCKCFKNKVKRHRNLSAIEAKMPNQYFCWCKNKTCPYWHWNRLQAKKILSLGSIIVSVSTIQHPLDWKCRDPHHRIQREKDSCGPDNFQSRCSKSPKRHLRSISPMEKSYIELQSSATCFPR